MADTLDKSDWEVLKHLRDSLHSFENYGTYACDSKPIFPHSCHSGVVLKWLDKTSRAL